MSDVKNAAAQAAEGRFKIRNKQGIHARPAALIVRTAAKFESEIIVEKDGCEAPAKSMLALLGLEGECGSEVRVRAEGRDAKDALTAIGKLFEDKFEEP